MMYERLIRDSGQRLEDFRCPYIFSDINPIFSPGFWIYGLFKHRIMTVVCLAVYEIFYPALKWFML